MLQKVKEALLSRADQKKKAGGLAKFFRAFPGGYGEGDTFLGVNVPEQRAIARQFYHQISLEEIAVLLRENIHEHRLTALFMLVLKFSKCKTEQEQQAIVQCYLQNIDGVNNWDLVDSSCYHILGPWLLNRDKQLLYDFAHSGDLWLQRIAMITTLHFIRLKDYHHTLKLAEILRNHPHDLIHKAVGWMLREVGNRDFDVEYTFLKNHYHRMPRTMLRYAIEKFDEEVRQKFLKGKI
ncbi:MAG: DNA alkylation repair protein [Bacteroidota bacterium]